MKNIPYFCATNFYMKLRLYILLIVLVLLLFFGGKKLPELAKGLGKGIKEFKDASSGVEKDEEKKENK